ncbi:MAG TPA: hypothetical protein VHZ55_34550 [Bryobacteraceae bacterium]|jgi:hypothetical protein|nr:hypothetical protein [Bryobacteraceae bacterium]
MQMRQDERRYANVILNDFGFCELGLRIQNLAYSGAFDFVPLNIERDLISGIRSLSTDTFIPRHISIVVTRA